MPCSPTAGVQRRAGRHPCPWEACRHEDLHLDLQMHSNAADARRVHGWQAPPGHDAAAPASIAAAPTWLEGSCRESGSSMTFATMGTPASLPVQAALWICAARAAQVGCGLCLAWAPTHGQMQLPSRACDQRAPDSGWVQMHASLQGPWYRLPTLRRAEWQAPAAGRPRAGMGAEAHHRRAAPREHALQRVLAGVEQRGAGQPQQPGVVRPPPGRPLAQEGHQGRVSGAGQVAPEGVQRVGRPVRAEVQVQQALRPQQQRQGQLDHLRPRPGARLHRLWDSSPSAGPRPKPEQMATAVCAWRVCG